MATEIRMPQLSDTMHSGKILSWNKNEGDSIDRGDILAEVETDKANLEIESFHKGTLLKILVPAGTEGAVGDVIAFIGEPGEDIPEVSNGSPAATTEAPASKPVEPVSAPNVSFETTESTRVKASPLAKRIAQERNVDLSTIRGSGPNGRITKKDVIGAEGGTAVAPSAPTAPQPAPSQPVPREPVSSGPVAGTLIPFSKMRETIARRMQESVAESPHFYTTVSVDMEEVFRTRKVLKEREDLKSISVNHFIIKAAAYALTREPKVNRAVRDGQIFEPSQINIGIITAIEDGLLIPVIREADKLSMRDLAFEARAAVDRARAGRPNATDLSGGTFSISNMGMYDVENFTAIINPGQGAVLAVSASKETPVVVDGQVTVRRVMKTTLSVDHRVIDGVMSATFLHHFKQALETPALLAI